LVRRRQSSGGVARGRCRKEWQQRKQTLEEAGSSQPIGKRHGLPTALAIVALACLSGVGRGYRAVSRFAKRLTKLQRRQLKCWLHPDTGCAHAPSEPVFQHVLQQAPCRDIGRLALAWQQDRLGRPPATDAVVIDGKEARGARLILGARTSPARSHLPGLDRGKPLPSLARPAPHHPADCPPMNQPQKPCPRQSSTLPGELDAALANANPKFNDVGLPGNPQLN
jgi:hypothetical protein